MSNYATSPGSANRGYAQSPSVQRRRSELADMDTALAGEGAWTQESHSKKRKPQCKYATISAARMSNYTGVTANNDWSDENVSTTETWACPSSVQLDSAQQTSFDTNMGQTAESTHAAPFELFCDRSTASVEEDLAARQLTSTAVASLDQPNLMISNAVHQWVSTPTGHRFAIPTIALDSGRASGRGRPNPQAGSASSSWVCASAAFYEVDRDTQGTGTGVLLPSDASYSTWLDVDHLAGARLNHYA